MVTALAADLTDAMIPSPPAAAVALGSAWSKPQFGQRPNPVHKMLRNGLTLPRQATDSTNQWLGKHGIGWCPLGSF